MALALAQVEGPASAWELEPALAWVMEPALAWVMEPAFAWVTALVWEPGVAWA